MALNEQYIDAKIEQIYNQLLRITSALQEINAAGHGMHAGHRPDNHTRQPEEDAPSPRRSTRDLAADRRERDLDRREEKFYRTSRPDRTILDNYQAIYSSFAESFDLTTSEDAIQMSASVNAEFAEMVKHVHESFATGMMGHEQASALFEELGLKGHLIYNDVDQLQGSLGLVIRSIEDYTVAMEEYQRYVEYSNRLSTRFMDGWHAVMDTISDTISDFRELNSVTRSIFAVGDAMGGLFTAISDTVNGVNKLGQALTRAGMHFSFNFSFYDIIFDVIKTVYMKLENALKAGVNTIPDGLLKAISSGLSSEQELFEKIIDNRFMIEGLGLSIDETTARMSEYAKSMILQTGDMAAGSDFVLRAMNTYANIAGQNANVEGMDKFIEGTKNKFADLQKSIGLTKDAFNSVVEQIESSVNIQNALYRLDEKRRLQYHNEMIMAIKKYKMDGLTLEQSQAYLDTLNDMTTQGATDRLTEAAKTRMAFSALGMSAEGEEYFRLAVAGARNTGDITRMGDLMFGLTEAYQSIKSAGDFGNEAFVDALFESAGIRSDVMDAGRAYNLQSGLRIEDSVSKNAGEQLTNPDSQYAQAAESVVSFTKQAIAFLNDPVSGMVNVIGMALDESGFFTSLSETLSSFWNTISDVFYSIAKSLQSIATSSWFGGSNNEPFSRSIGTNHSIRDRAVDEAIVRLQRNIDSTDLGQRTRNLLFSENIKQITDVMTVDKNFDIGEQEKLVKIIERFNQTAKNTEDIFKEILDEIKQQRRDTRNQTDIIVEREDEANNLARRTLATMRQSTSPSAF